MNLYNNRLLPETQPDVLVISPKSLSPSTVNTPFGILQIFSTPDPAQFQYEPSSGYFYDQLTGFYYDPKTNFYYSPKSRSWKFWCLKYSTYIDCEGGNISLKRRLQVDDQRQAKTRDDPAPPSKAEHRHALRNAPPPPTRDGDFGSKQIFHDSSPITREDLEQLVSAMVKRGIDEEWRNLRKRRSPTRSQSPRHGGKRDEHWRDERENDRKSRHDDRRRSRSRDRSRDHWRTLRSPDQQVHDQEPMNTASPLPSPTATFEGDSWTSSSNNRGMPPTPVFNSMRPHFSPFPANFLGVPLFSPPERIPAPMFAQSMLNQDIVRHGLPIGGFTQFVPRTPNMPLDIIRHNKTGFERAEGVISGTPPLEPRFLNRPASMPQTPGVPLGYMGTPQPSPKKLFFIDPLHAQQVRYPAALSATAAHAMSTSAFSSTLCGGNKSGVVNELDPSNQQQQQKKSQLLSKERDEVNNLGICFNCGRHGHSLFQCRFERISDDELQKKIRAAKTKLQRQELDKQELKRKAEKYPLRRKDPLIQRLRAAAPEGKIKMEHIRMLCTKCAFFNHTRMECSRFDIGRTLHKQILSQLEEFKKVFFVHLQEDNMVDFSQKFETFRIMDGIEQSGTIDPVGLQLQGRCPDGIVTQMDLRELCSNCAQLGHKRFECPEKTECSRTHYDKMLELVKAYRVLVKEGNGNFVLPTAKMMNPPVLVLKDIVRSEPVEEIVLLESTDEEDNGTTGVEEMPTTIRTIQQQQRKEEKERAVENKQHQNDDDDDVIIVMPPQTTSQQH